MEEGWYEKGTLVSSNTSLHFTITKDTLLYASFSETLKDRTIICDDYLHLSIHDNAFLLNASTIGDGKLGFFTTNNKVVDISDEGIVTVHGIGTAKIYVVAPMTEKYEAAEKEILVDVSCENTNITSKLRKTNVKCGDTISYSISVQNRSNSTVKWYYSDPLPAIEQDDETEPNWILFENQTSLIFNAQTDSSWEGRKIYCEVTCDGITEKTNIVEVHFETNDRLFASGECGDFAEWNLDKNGVLTLYGLGATDSYRIQNTAKTFTSGLIPPWFNYCMKNGKTITAIEVQYGIKEIGSGAFIWSGTDYTYQSSINPSRLEYVILPSTLEHIEQGILACSSVDKVVIPGNVKFDSNISNAIWGYASKIDTVVFEEGITEIPDDCFWACSVEEVILPSTLVRIGSSAFEGRKIQKINLPEGLQYIGMHAFSNCHNLQVITIPETVTVIDMGAFNYCDSLNAIIFKGDAPQFSSPNLSDDIFTDVTAAAYYPSNNSAWTDEVMKNYNGNLTWICSDNYIEGFPVVKLWWDDDETLTASISSAQNLVEFGLLYCDKGDKWRKDGVTRSDVFVDTTGRIRTVFKELDSNGEFHFITNGLLGTFKAYAIIQHDGEEIVVYSNRLVNKED